MTEIFKNYADPNLDLVAFTGMGGKKAAEILGGIHINEIIAQAAAVGRIHPEVRTVIEMGGEDSKLIFMANGEVSEQSRLSDLSMNSFICYRLPLQWRISLPVFAMRLPETSELP